MAGEFTTALKGKVCKISLFGADVAAVNWTLAVDGKLDDISNFKVGRKKAATLDDATLTTTIIETDPPSAIGSITTGLEGIAKCYTAASLGTWIELPIVIGQVTPKVDDQEKITRLDVSAAFSAFYVGTVLHNSIEWSKTS